MSRKQRDLMTQKKLTLAYAKHYQRAPSKSELPRVCRRDKSVGG